MPKVKTQMKKMDLTTGLKKKHTHTQSKHVLNGEIVPWKLNDPIDAIINK